MIYTMDSKVPANLLISRKNMEERAQLNSQRIHDVGISCGFIKDATDEFESLETERIKELHWQKHLRCDGLPRPYIPAEMRTFIASKQHNQQFKYDNSVDWTLSVDNRSLLTQNIYRVDKTRNTMKVKRSDHIGEYYQKDIDMFLETLVNIECMLDNPCEMSKVDHKLENEIMKVRKEIEQEIVASFDRLTYRIIRMDGVYMESVDSIVAKWGHKCEQFSIDIWGLRDVSIRFDQFVAPMLVAELANVAVSVQMPESVLHDRLTLRCIHTKFDTYSQNAKSYDPVIPEGGKDSVLDIEEVLALEWDMQVEIQEEMLVAMLAKREAYEEVMRLIIERTEKAKRDKDDEGSKALPIPKPPKEPIKLPPDMLPDAINVFLEREQQEYIDSLDEIYNPQNLNMHQNEINLRQYVILGGIYSIGFLHQPQNTNYSKMNVILNDRERLLHEITGIVANKHKRHDSILNKRSSNLTGRVKQNINENPDRMSRVMLEDNDLPYFFVTLHLTQDLCLWGEPVACQYLTEVEEIEPEIETALVDDRKSTVRHKKVSRLKSQITKRSTKNFSKNRNSDQPNIFRPTLLSAQRHSLLLPPEETIIPVKNFSLLKQLNQCEIRQLERYCVPRIISSFKLPQEIREDIQMSHKPKPRNILKRRRSAEEDVVVDLSYIDFGFDDQDAPERMFPIFKGVEHVILDETKGAEAGLPHPKSVYGILNTLDGIRQEYCVRHVPLMSQPEYVGPKRLPKKKPIQKTDNLRQSKMSLGAIPDEREDEAISPVDTTAVPEENTVVRKSTVEFQPSVISMRVESQLETDETRQTETSEQLPLEGKKVDETPKIKVTHWTTKHILATHFDRKNRTISIKTDRLGIFGLAFKRYEHFPFRDWCLNPNEENPDEVVLRVDTFHARVMLYISAQGVRGYVTDLAKGYVAKPVKYLDITTPIADFRVLRARFLDKSINIFADQDASYYIDNGYFSVKHVATEDHIYDTMALHCKLMKFYRSSWNRLASRRNLLICMKLAKDTSTMTEVTLRIQPDSATFVEVSELCSDNLDIIKLDYKETWRNMSDYTDLHQTITSMTPNASELRNKDSLLLFQLKRMLHEIHLLSYS